MTDIIRTWIPQAAWWIPVWITIDNPGESTDALETAVAGLVRAGLRAPGTLARELCLDIALVESAVATLQSAGVLTLGGEGLTATDARDPMEGPRARPGFVVWDPSAQRPLVQLWLDRDLPPDDLPSLPGWQVVPWNEPVGKVSHPRDGEVGRYLSALPSAGDLRVFEPRGSGVYESDGACVRRLRRRSGRSEYAPVWVPIEHRTAGTVVWRPSLRPLAEIGTELDPAGYEGIERRALSVEARDALADADNERRARIAPGVLREAGFASVGELQGFARAEALRALGVIAEVPAWASLVEAVQGAIEDERLSLVVGGDWRRPLRAWGDVLEYLTGLVMERLRPRFRDLKSRQVDPDELARLRPLLGQSTRSVKDVVVNPDKFRRLQASLNDGLDSIGTRLLAVGVCAWLHPGTRRALEALDREAPGLFETFHKAKEERNAVVHPKADTEPIGVAGHRARVVLLCKMLPRLVERT